MIGTMKMSPRISSHRYLLVLIGCSLLTSCTQLQPVKKYPVQQPSTQVAAEVLPSPAQQLISAKCQIALGEYGKSGKILEEMISRPTEAGITDEALFQLAVLNLTTNTREGSTKSYHLLQRLIKEYPRSHWAHLGQPLLELLDNLAEQRRQISSSKNQNQSLAKEIKELHQTIDRLKSLDLEMEKRSRR